MKTLGTTILERQHGAALVVSLIILLLITMIGTTAMQTTVMEDQMATNMLDRQLAFEAAEAALRDAETWLRLQTVNPGATSNGSSTIWTNGILRQLTDADNTNDLNVAEIDWAGSSIDYGSLTSVPGLSGVHMAPGFVIEEVAFLADDESTTTKAMGLGFYYYRISARGIGGSADAQVILQTMFRKRYL